MSGKAAVLVALCLLGIEPAEEVCRHPGRGRTSPVSLDRVRRAQEGVARRFAAAADASSRADLAAGFESGLPSCVARRTRRVRADIPAALVGRRLAFAPEGRFPEADVRVAASARSLWTLEADALADPALAARLDVRCVPTLVIPRSEVEIEIVELP